MKMYWDDWNFIIFRNFRIIETITPLILKRGFNALKDHVAEKSAMLKRKAKVKIEKNR